MDGGETGRLSQAPCCFWFHRWNRPGLRALRPVERTTRALTALGAALIAGPRGWWFAEPLTPALKHSFASAASIGSIAAPRRVPRRAGSPARHAAFAATSPTPWGTQLARSGRPDVQRTVPAEPRRDPVPAPPVDRQILPTALPRTATPFALLTITPQGRGNQDGLVAEANIAVYVGSSAMQTGD